jgi:type IV secretory pathway TraG/TraD family ATPase VirD4
MLGEGTVSHPVEQHQGGLLGRRSVSYQHVARGLLTADELMELDPAKEILHCGGIKPVLADKLDYRTDPVFADRAL